MSSDMRNATSAKAGARRSALLEAAAHLVSDAGPAALTARGVAQRASVSTMAVYTAFGSMETLVRAVVEEGFDRLERRFAAVAPSEDPLADIARQTQAYVDHARAEPDLYAVMFSTAALGRYRLTGRRELQEGRRGTLDLVAGNWQRAMDGGRVPQARASTFSFRWWALVHGYAMLEAAGNVALDRGPVRVLEPLLVDLFVGEGDDRGAARRSVSEGLRH